MPDEIALLSAELARDPAGTAFLALADALRRARRLAEAERIALRGLERHPYLADAHDLLAKIRADAGDLTSARDEWEMTLRLEPGSVAARKGLAFLAFRRGDHVAAVRYLAEACSLAPDDATLADALRRARAAGTAMETAQADQAAATATPPTPVARARSLFADLEASGATAVLLIDRGGLVLAGAARDASGRDASDDLGAELSGVSDEASHAVAQLHLGGWQQLVIECDHGTLAVAPSRDECVALVATVPGTPVGLTRMLLDRTRRRADGWLEAL